MIIDLPTSARLRTIEAFTRRIYEAERPGLELIIPNSYFSVHPLVLAAVGAAAVHARDEGAEVSVAKYAGHS